MIAINSTDLEELSAREQQNGDDIFYQTHAETLSRLPKSFGIGGERTTQLRYGLNLIVREAELYQSIQIENSHHEEFPLVSKFHLSGNSRVLTPRVSGVREDYQEISGCNYLYYLPDLVEFEEWRSQELIQIVIVLIDLECLRAFGTGFDGLPEPLQQLVNQTSANRFHQPLGKTTIAMQEILQQILRCPYQGIMRLMYLESKVLELLTLQFKGWGESLQALQPPILKSKDIERLHHAREVLIQDLENPPPLIKLAQQVGISERKLKQGFRQMFGKTVFGYLHDYRLEQARQLLEQNNMTVAEVSYAVGFANRGHFAAALALIRGSFRWIVEKMGVFWVEVTRKRSRSSRQ